MTTVLAPAETATHCPVCQHENSQTAEFCVQCHAVLLRRCPKCWHRQREGAVCEKCGTNFALYWADALERSLKEEARVERDKIVAEGGTFAQLVLMPFNSLGGVLRALVARLLAIRLSRR